METLGDVVLRNDERARRAGVAGGVPPDELQTLRGNKVRAVAVEKQRAVDDTPVHTYRYEERHSVRRRPLLDRDDEGMIFSEGATAEEAMMSQPEFEIEIKYRCGGATSAPLATRPTRC